MIYIIPCDRRSNVTANYLPNASRLRLCRLVALLRRLHPAQAQGRWAGSKRNAPSRLCTAFASSGSSLFFLASSAPICPLASPRSPPTATSQPELLAILALLTVRIRPLFWLFVVAFNLVGAADIIVDYYHAIQVGLPALAGQLGAAYAIPIIYVPLLMITHFVAFYWLVRPPARQAAK